ncbi:RNA polymerase sigma-70 factor [Streptomyces sp. T-3]|nr:RNA polymerase sigma-70 factor [Streptomyces sp. T-3]
MTQAALAEEFETHRPRMFSLAYRLLGSAEEAEDAVQDAYLRWNGTDREVIGQPAAWLAKVVTNLCLNRLTSARARREQYIGPWLPEPVLTSGGALGPLESAEQRDAVSMALLVLLEQLTPVERAVYVLREAFAYSHREIADVLDRSEADCRQLYRRAAQRVQAGKPRFEARDGQWRGLVEQFMGAAREGDLAGLEKLLAQDVTWWADSDGKVSAARRPVVGSNPVARLVLGLMERFTAGLDFAFAEVNGCPAVVVLATGQPVSVVVVEAAEGVVTGLRAVRNPEKLEFLSRQLSHPGNVAGS